MRQYLFAAAFALISITAGFSSLNFLAGSKIRFNLQPDTVAASTRNQYTFGSPIVAHTFSGAVLQRGRLVHILPSDHEYNGNQTQAILHKGEALLALDDATIKIGDAQLESRNPATGSPHNISSHLLIALTKLNFKKLLLRNSEIEIALPGKLPERLSHTHMVVTKSQKGAINASGTAVWRKQNVEVDLKTGPVHQAEARMPVNLSIKSDHISVRFNGALIRADRYLLDGDISIDIKRLQKFGGLFDIAWPNFANFETFHLSGPIKWSDSAIAFERADIKLDENDASGALTIKTTKKRPLLSGTLAFDELRLSDSTPTETRNASLQDHWWFAVASRLWSEPLTTIFDADLRLSAKQVLVRSTVLDKVAATLSLKENKLSARLASLNYEGGSGNGQLTVNFNEFFPQMTIRGKLNGIHLGDISNAVTGHRVFEGPADVILDIETSGTPLKSALKNASGHVKISQTEKGAIAFDLASLAGSDTPSPDRAAQFFAHAQKGKTQIDSFSALIQFKKGEMEYSKLDAEFGAHIAKGAGRIDLLSQSIYMRFLIHKRTALKEDDQDVNSKTNKPILKNIAAGLITLQGPLVNPGLHISKIYGQQHTLKEHLKAHATPVLKD